jgi:sialic acid synthase SpsE
MGRTFVIAEAGSSHDNDLAKAYRLIEAAKECGADAVKFQWTSKGAYMAKRRGLGGDASVMYQTYLQKPESWLYSLKQHADKVGIEFMCTAYLIEDIAVLAPLVKRFKVSAFESEWDEFVEAHYYKFKETIVSTNDAYNYKPPSMKLPGSAKRVCILHCVSKYPTPIEELKLDCCRWEGVDGLSDHTANPLVGALAVAAGATIIESHIRLDDTNPGNPDYPHSLSASKGALFSYAEYVANIRTAEKCL